MPKFVIFMQICMVQPGMQGQTHEKVGDGIDFEFLRHSPHGVYTDEHQAFRSVSQLNAEETRK